MSDYVPSEFPDYLNPNVVVQIRRMAIRRVWGHVNIYTCGECGGKLVTTDLDEGTTPFMTSCRTGECQGYAQSAMYRIDPRFSFEVTHGWHRPATLDGIHGVDTIDHLKNGGLILRELTDEERG